MTTIKTQASKIEQLQKEAEEAQIRHDTLERTAAEKQSAQDYRDSLKRPGVLQNTVMTQADIKKSDEEFKKAVADDLDTPKALSVVWKLIHEYHKKQECGNPKEILKFLYDADGVFGLGLKNVKFEQVPVKILRIAQERETFRKRKEWAKADELREKMAFAGWAIEDTAHGPTVKRNR